MMHPDSLLETGVRVYSAGHGPLAAKLRSAAPSGTPRQLFMVLCVYVFSDADGSTLHQPNSVVNVATSLAAKPSGGDGPSPHQSSHSHPSSVSLVSAHIIDVLTVSRSVTCTCHHGILINVVSLGIMDQVKLAPELVVCFTGART
jgi:hypothetical protein